MGASFNYVVVPKKIQNNLDLQKFYEDTKEKLYKKYGDDFEGYSGDLASDNDELEIKENLFMRLPEYKTIMQKKLDNDYGSVEKICEFIQGHAEKWGPSIAIRVNDQWVICGFYSD
jgi:hypothetical protein